MDLAGWWRRARTLVHPIGEREPLDPDELERRLVAAMPLDLGPRLALPDDFKRYLDAIGRNTYLSQRIDRDFLLWPASSILATAASDARLAEDAPALVREQGPWIAIAQRGDRDAFFLCVDRESDELGQVVLGDDSHPWLEGGYFTPRGRFAEWLDSLRPRRPQASMIRLTPDEAALLARARATGAWEAVVAARDLELALTPDSAWARIGAPDRLIAPPDDLDDADRVTAEECELIFLPGSLLVVRDLARS